MDTFHLKTRTDYFELVHRGIKPFEVRLGDRPYKVGDHLVLEEVDHTGEYTGRTVERQISTIVSALEISTLFAPEDIKRHGLVVLGLYPPKYGGDTP
jgi:ASC-1-like (ASCH) protein